MNPTTELDRSNMAGVEAQLDKHLRALRRAAITNKKLDHSMAAVETFCAVALRVMKRAEPEDVRDAALTVEIKARMDGVPVIRGAR